MDGDTERKPRVELCVRSLCPGAMERNQEHVVDRLQRLDEAGAIEAFDLTVWGDRVALDSPSAHTDEGERALARYALFRRWADETGRSIGSFFDVRSVEQRITGESYTAVVFPALTLAEYVDGELRHVAPSTDGERLYTVADRLDALAAAADREPDADADDRPLAPADER